MKKLTKAEIWWDTSDPSDEGWAYRVTFNYDVTTQEGGEWEFVVIHLADAVVELVVQYGVEITADEVSAGNDYRVWEASD